MYSDQRLDGRPVCTRRVFGIAVTVFTLASVVCGLTQNVPMLIASRMLQGAGAIASTLQQLSLSFGLACGSLVAGRYLGKLPQTEQLAIASALHHAFLTFGVITILSSISFWTLRPEDGASVSRGGPAPEAKESAAA